MNWKSLSVLFVASFLFLAAGCESGTPPEDPGNVTVLEE